MDCNEAKEQMFAYLDGELDEDGIPDIEAHFEECLPCYKRIILERAFVKLVKARASGRPVPAGLESRIRNEISSRASEVRWPSPDTQPLFLLLAASLLVTALGFTFPATSLSSSQDLHRDADLDGTLICVRCLMDEGAGTAKGHRHRNGLKAADGRIWHILDDGRGRDLIFSPDQTGHEIHVRGRLHGETQTIAVSSYR